MPRAPALHLLFFVSGAAGLVYEVVWVRQFGYVFGSSVYSVALVTGLYMLGLGVGGFAFGRFADVRFREDARAPLRWYGRLELGIAALALLLALALPRLEALSGALSAYVVDPATGWQRLSLGSSALRYGVALLLLGPLTVMMGGTLTLLIRHVVAFELAAAGWRIGALYAVNTAGAMLGCLLTDLALVPALGVLATQGLAVGLNLAAGLGALALARSLGARAAPTPAAPVAEPLEARARGPLRFTALAIALTGLASMGMQVVWFRHLVSVFGGYRAVFSVLLAVILLGLWLGSLLGGWLARRAGRPAASYAVAQALFTLSALGALWLFEPRGFAAPGWLLAVAPLLGEDAAFSLQRHLVLAVPMLWVVGLPTLFMGLAFPLANAIVQRVGAEVGRRAGLLYLANTLGGVSGSLLAGFLLLPALGTQQATLLLVGCAAASLVPIALGARAAGPERRGGLVPVAAGCGGLCAAALLAWAVLPPELLVRRSLRLGDDLRVLAISEGLNETISVVEKPGAFRSLMTNGHAMSSTNLGSQRYMRAFAHVPLLLHPAPRRVMVMCFGVGTTLHATTMHPSVERVDVVDYSDHVLRHAHYFEGSNGGALADPRVRVFVNDARQHLRMMPEASYDLVTGEPPPIAYAGVVTLYTREFFQLARSRLRPGGLLSYWLPVEQVSAEVGLAIVRAFLDAFPDAVLLSGYRQSLILLGSNAAEPPRVDPEQLVARVAETPGLAEDLRRVWLTPLELVGSFVASSQHLARVTRGVAPVADAHPILEYGAVAFSRDGHVSPALFDATDVGAWCPRCVSDPGSPIPRDTLASYLEVMQRYYTSDAFLGRRGDREFRVTRRERERLRESRYLRHLLGSDGGRPGRGAPRRR